MAQKAILSDSYERSLESDIETLQKHNNALERKNGRLRKKLKIANYLVPTALVGGIVLGVTSR